MTKQKDTTHDEKVVEDVLQGLSLEDQIGQMSQIDIAMLLEDSGAGGKRLNLDQVKHYIGELGIGSVLNTVPGIPWTAADYRQAAVQIQTIAKEYHRPPVIWGLDSVHGANYVHGANLTPQPINLAATFNVTTARSAGLVASRDTRAAGISWLFSPLLGIALQPYWSRVYETFGEDPIVVGQMAAAMIDGIQAVDSNPAAVPSRAAACGKHFVGYSYPHNGHDRSPSWIPRRHLYQYFVPPWQQAMEANVMTVMESYTEFDGVPNVANPDTTRYLLRQRLEFPGVLVTDYQEILNLHDWHKTVGDAESAVAKALTKGTVDMSMIPWDPDSFRNGTLAAVRQNRITAQRIEESARRVLQLKQQLNMFDEELTESDPNLDLVGSDDDMMLDMARQSIVLAKNDNDTLPWSANKGKKVLVTGPTAASLIYQTGGWSGQWQGAPNEDDWFTTGSSVLKALSSNAAGLDISYACGTNILGGECDDDTSKQGIMDQVEGWVGLGPHNSVDRAVQAATEADLVIVCVGEEAYAEKPGDIRSLRLPDGQYKLVQSVQKSSKAKIVLVYFGGRPRLLGSMVEQSNAVLMGFLPGPSGGDAIADIVLGAVNPSARMPITYPAFDDAAGSSPYFHAVSDQCTYGAGTLPHYEYTACEVQWPFGHGLSYTDFVYSGLVVTGNANTEVQISFDVKNAGAVSGAEAVMIFTFDEYRSTTPEYKRLRSFQKVFLASGESTSVLVTLTPNELAFIGPDDDTHYITDPQKPFWVGVGASVDCRAMPDDSMCAKVEGDSLASLVDPSCTAACDLWIDSGCAVSVGFSETRCMEMCANAGKEPLTYSGVGSAGWGWNYVQCLESVKWGMEHSKTSRCELMTLLCRDIFRTDGVNSFGSGSLIESPEHSTPPSTFVALFAGLISSAIIFLALRGLYRPKNDRDIETVQFTTVTTTDDHDVS